MRTSEGEAVELACELVRQLGLGSGTSAVHFDEHAAIHLPRLSGRGTIFRGIGVIRELCSLLAFRDQLTGTIASAAGCRVSVLLRPADAVVTEEAGPEVVVVILEVVGRRIAEAWFSLDAEGLRWFSQRHAERAEQATLARYQRHRLGR